MKANLQILLISSDHYYQGLLKGYCHAQRYAFFSLADNKTIIKEIFNIHFDLIIVDMRYPMVPLKKDDWQTLQTTSINYRIPVCALRNKKYHAAPKLDSWIDAFFNEPLNIEQLDGYLRKKFSQQVPAPEERRIQERRAMTDRRAFLRDKDHDAGLPLEPMRQTLPNNGKNEQDTAGPFRIDRRFKTVSLHGKAIDLTRKEFELFELLSRDAGRVLMAEDIIHHLWPGNSRATKSDLYQYMHLLRKKIEKDPDNPQWILTVKGFGYRLDAQVAAEVNASEKSHAGLGVWRIIAPIAQ